MSLRDFFKETKYDGRPVLICGKGPSLREVSKANLSDYNVWTLNHAINKVTADYAHVIDFDVLKDCQESIYNNAKYLVVPYWMHFYCRPVAEIPTSKMVESNEFLKKMHTEGRLLCYNLSTAYKFGLKVGDSPMVKAKHYSAEAVVSLVGLWGAKDVVTVGVDGGKSTLEGMPNINGERGYDTQWEGIRRSISRFNLRYSPLGIECPIRIFVGAGEAQLIPALVLKHSILKHATMSVDVTIMNEWKHPMPKDRKNWPRTPFSFQRFMIPERCNYQGHAIYMDSDMLVFGDVKEIWQEALNKDEDLLVMRNDDVDKHRAKYSVFKMNCENLPQWDIQVFVSLLNKGNYSYEELMFDFRNGARSRDGFNPDWNSLEEYTEDKTKLIHYTEMYNQPWLVNPNHHLGYLWFNELKELVKEQPAILTIVQDHVKRGWILPKCLEVLDETRQTTPTL